MKQPSFSPVAARIRDTTVLQSYRNTLEIMHLLALA
jgi:hypothetical protein